MFKRQLVYRDVNSKVVLCAILSHCFTAVLFRSSLESCVLRHILIAMRQYMTFYSYKPTDSYVCVKTARFHGVGGWWCYDSETDI